jgi:hypothetical protein
MTESRKPPDGEEERAISLPSWVDDAIARSKDPVPSESEEIGDVGPASELSVAPPPPPADEPQREHPVAPPPGSQMEEPAPVEVGSPMDARRRAVMPWVALALIFAAAALVLGYILLTTPK